MKTKSKHTPGPWFREGSCVFSKHGAYFLAECEMRRHSFCKSGAEAEANAALISAAPDLLSALETIKMQIEDQGLQDRFTLGLSKIDYAISKAKGEV